MAQFLCGKRFFILSVFGLVYIIKRGDVNRVMMPQTRTLNAKCCECVFVNVLLAFSMPDTVGY